MQFKTQMLLNHC